MNLKEIGIKTRQLAQDIGYWTAIVNAELNLRAPLALELVNKWKKEQKMPRQYGAGLVAEYAGVISARAHSTINSFCYRGMIYLLARDCVNMEWEKTCTWRLITFDFLRKEEIAPIHSLLTGMGRLWDT